MAKKRLIALGALVGLLVLVAAGVWLFVDADQFRPKLEVMMSEALGRRVTIGRLRIALFSGGVAAEDLMIADDPAFSELLTKAGGVWFGGGRQWRFVDAYAGTLTEKRFREVLARGGAVGGSSAGASIQSEYMPRGHPLGNTVMMITHDVDEAVLLSDRIVMMTNGPAAYIGEILDVPLPRPRKRLELVANPTYIACRQRVLDRFYRRPGSEPTGSGLGLAIVLRIAERHRAALTLDDSPLGGLRVALVFPPATGDSNP